MIAFRLSFTTYLALRRACTECNEISLKHPERGQVPPVPVNEHLRAELCAVAPSADKTFLIEMAPEDVEQLVLLLPACALEHADDPAELSARLDVWPEELEAAQAELLAGLGRT